MMNLMSLTHLSYVRRAYSLRKLEDRVAVGVVEDELVHLHAAGDALGGVSEAAVRRVEGCVL